MQKTVLAITISGFICFLICCKQENNKESESSNSIDTTKKELWAELVETNTMLVKPEGWDDEYWKSVHKNINNGRLFKTIVDAVISGRKKAYDIFTDSVLTTDEVKEMVRLDKTTNKDTQPVAVGPDDLSLIRMREKWIFDKENFKLEKQVSRIDLIYKKLNENGEYIGDKPLFYVYLN